MVLLETKLPHAGPVRLHPVQDRHLALVARDALKTGRTAEDDSAVGQVAGVIVVHVRLIAPRYLPQSAPVGANLENLKMAGIIPLGKQQPVGVEMEVHVANEPVAVRLVQSCQFPVRCDG